MNRKRALARLLSVLVPAPCSSQVELAQVNLEEHAGTLADLYTADGILFDSCYPLAT